MFFGDLDRHFLSLVSGTTQKLQGYGQPLELKIEIYFFSDKGQCEYPSFQ